ncbi:MAG: ABC transporter permease [Aestuariivirga sp.]|uniref:ABC transporter permease n=1 Tax=Aestuariivirga sp. TaxID=2650926 RepID=UPI0030174D21
MSDGTAKATSPNTHLMVPIFIFSILLSAAAMRGPDLISSNGLGSAIIVAAPLILATYALTIIVMAGRAAVDLSIGPLIGFINVGMIQLQTLGYIESPIAFFLYALGVGVAYQLLLGLIIIFVRVQPIIVSLSGYLALVGLNLIILPRPGGVAPDWMLNWGSGTSIFSPVLAILVIATAAWYLLATTAFFGHLRLMGSDERAAYTSGVRINYVRLGAHGIAGLYAGLAAICFTSLISSGDPTQGTTFTLLAVTALVLGGANLAGGRGGAIGSLFGAMNIYLITYLLGTFNFSIFQSFVTDLSYGSILVLSLLFSLALPHIQRAAHYLPPGRFIAILGCIAGGVILHAVMDVSTLPEALDAAVSVAVQKIIPVEGAPLEPTGTIILLVILGIAAVIYLVNLLFKYPRPPLIAFLVLVIVTILGLVFNPDPAAVTEATIAVLPAHSGMGTGLEYMALESSAFDSGVGVYMAPLQNAGHGIIVALGVTLLATLLIGFNMPARRVAGTSAPVSLGALLFAGIALLAVVVIKAGDISGMFGSETLIVLLIAMGLFIMVFSPIQSRIPYLSSIYISALGLIAVGFVYFQASQGDVGAHSAVTDYAPSVFGLASVLPQAQVTYAIPGHLDVAGGSLLEIGPWSYSILVIVGFQFAVWLAMRGGVLIRDFWPYMLVVVGAAGAWSAMFCSIGVSLWNIIAVVVVCVLTSTFVWRGFRTFAKGLSLEGGRR